MLVRYIAVLAMMPAFGIVIHGPAQADAATDVKKTLQTIYNKRDVATQKKDVSGSLSTLAPDFVYVAKDGQKGDVKLLKRRLTPLFALMLEVKAKSDVQKLTVKGKQATATVKQHLEMLVVNPQTQQPQRFIANATSEDLWTKTGSGWLQKRMTTKTETAALDGRAINERIKLDDKPASGHTADKKKNSRPGGSKG